MGESKKRIKVAVVGASGYTGGELLRLLAGHPLMEVTAVTSEKSAGSAIVSVFPHLAASIRLSFEALDPEAIAARADAVFLALPHTKSFAPARACLTAGKPVVDLSADYRLKEAAAYETWYQASHPYPELLKEAVYGLPELHREDIRRSRLTASPGCYPTAAILQLAPLVAHKLIRTDSIIVDAKSGVSGAGRGLALPYHFPEAHESLEAYKIGRHRHIPEIEQELRALAARPGGEALAAGGSAASPLTIAFTPHLVPMNRGILSTAYCRLLDPIGTGDLRSLYADFYKGDAFIRIKDGEASANPGHVRGSNFCDIGLSVDSRAGWVITTAAIDNLVKGAAGQAIQAMNLMLGFPEDLGLLHPALFP